jgi:hypothetical protein
VGQGSSGPGTVLYSHFSMRSANASLFLISKSLKVYKTDNLKYIILIIRNSLREFKQTVLLPTRNMFPALWKPRADDRPFCSLHDAAQSVTNAVAHSGG